MKTPTLLTRDRFRESVFERDQYKCVCCGSPAVDAHHIVERRLFTDGGYYLDNGASVCGVCHLKCEQTLITCDELRDRIGIKRPILPLHFYEDTSYDKWGNILMQNGTRLRGELFDDASVQKALHSVLHEFTPYVKYGRTYHLPWSPGMHSDDRMMPDVEVFNDKIVVVMEKLDGENCLPSTTRILMADGSHKLIGELVRSNAVGQYVMGVTEDGVTQPSKILNVFYKGTRTTPWTQVRCKGPHGHSQCVVGTPEHRIFTQRGYVQLQNVEATDTCYAFDSSLDLSDTQRSVLLGKLIGDGSLHPKRSSGMKDNRKALVQYSHKRDHQRYVEWTNAWLGDLHSGTCLDATTRYGDTICVKSWTKQTNAIYETFIHMIQHGKKTFPVDLIDMASPITLAFWYMDDGSLNHTAAQQDRMLISVCGFDQQSCENLQLLLLKFGIDSTLTTQTGYRYLYINWINTNKLARLIAPYVPDCMRYKLPVAYRSVPLTYAPIESNALAGRLVEMSVVSVKTDHETRYTGLYDLETETHNYFANSTLVHNSTLYRDHIHARSVTSGGHPSRNWIRAFHGQIQADIPEMWRINVENVFAKHSIFYKNLETYAYGFAMWDDTNHILPWKDTLEWFQCLGIVPCPVIFWGLYDRQKIEEAYKVYKALREQEGGEIEGYVIRVDEPFHFSQFKHNVGKYVREGHVQTTQHWMHGQPLVQNQLNPGLSGFESLTRR